MKVKNRAKVQTFNDPEVFKTLDMFLWDIIGSKSIEPTTEISEQTLTLLKQVELMLISLWVI